MIQVTFYPAVNASSQVWLIDDGMISYFKVLVHWLISPFSIITS